MSTFQKELRYLLQTENCGREFLALETEWKTVASVLGATLPDQSKGGGAMGRGK